MGVTCHTQPLAAMLSLGQSLASAAGLRPRKKFHFDVVFNLQDLLNCTYVSGVLFVKIRLKDGGHFSHISQRVEVKSHAVSWDEEVKFPCKLYASANTAELEPCFCKVSIRKEARGGRSYKKLGYVRINLAEFAGAGVVQRKYLLESYNEHKHKPDNSILRVKIMLKQTSGDVLFKAPRPPVWEISEPEQDEGIQADLQSARKDKLSSTNIRASTASTLSGLSTGSSSGNLRIGSSLQDMRHCPQEPGTAKSNSACNLRGQTSGQTSDSGSSEYESADPHSSSSSVERELSRKSEEKPKSQSPELGTPGSTTDTPREQAGAKPKHVKKPDSLPERSNSVACSELRVSRPPVESYSLSYPRSHRREASDVAAGEGGSPLRAHHRRIHSLSISGYSSRSTSAYSTLSERSERPTTDDTESLHSSKTRISVQTMTSRVEHSRVDTNSVIDELLQGHDLRRSEEDEEAGGGGLKIYVDRNRGDCVVAGPDLERRFSNLKPIEMTSGSSHTRHKKSGSSGSKEDKEHSNSREAHSADS